ncbi:hypothetical protein AAFF_G00090320 [Aldrovandia affinis]|uniref:Uncharacterized protein n=1 Tax=Aldrovandia affinis TaxID=143900 RepID=A0AAD7RW81_9TELE|nr:hypothetical protein AAFF_G00090320 [Aldrovandia affinis]
MKSKSVYLFVHFLHDVLEELQDMSNTFQKVNSSAMTIHRAMNQCLSTITKYKTRSTLTEAHLNDLMAVKMMSPEIGNFDPTRAIEMWNRDEKYCKRPHQKDRTRKKPATAVVEVHAAQPEVVTVEPQEEKPGNEAAAAEDSDIDSRKDDSDNYDLTGPRSQRRFQTQVPQNREAEQELLGPSRASSPISQGSAPDRSVIQDVWDEKEEEMRRDHEDLSPNIIQRR